MGFPAAGCRTGVEEGSGRHPLRATQPGRGQASVAEEPDQRREVGRGGDERWLLF